MKFAPGSGILALTFVAPVRERGLKYNHLPLPEQAHRRSRKGAWIEILSSSALVKGTLVAPVRERGLKFKGRAKTSGGYYVAPVRERGLK